MAHRSIRPISIAMAAVMTAGGVALAAAPAAAQDFEGIATLDEFVIALTESNQNGEPDVISLALDTEQTWDFAGALPVEDDLTIQLTPGSATVTFRSVNDSAFLLAADVRFAASGVGFTGLGDPGLGIPGTGIDAAIGADLVLDDVRLNGSSGDGLFQIGGTLTASNVDALGNGGAGLNLAELDAVTLTDVLGDGNSSAVVLVMDGGSAAIERLTATNNGSTGLVLEAEGGTVAVSDSRFETNGNLNDFLFGGGVAVSAWDGAEVTFTGVTIADNSAFIGGGLLTPELAGLGTEVSLVDSSVTGNEAFYGAGIGAGGTGANAIDDGATFTVENTMISDNRASEVGGGIHIEGIGDASFELLRSTVHANSAGSAGGGLSSRLAQGGHLLLDSSTVSQNTAVQAGAGMLLECDGDSDPDVWIVDSTISGNASPEVAALAAGCVGSDPAFGFANSTISANESEAGPAVYLGGGAATIRNTIIGGNPGDLDLALDFVGATIDYSLVQHPAPGPTTTIVTSGTGNITGEAPHIEPLADNGGPTRTHLPIAGGNVAEAGDPDFVPPPEIDQRGEPRVDGRLDIGSVELQRPPHVLPATGGAAPSWLLLLAVLMLAGGAVACARRLEPHR